MMRCFRTLVLLITVLASHLIQTRAPAPKSWTFLVYMAADNNLEPYVIINQTQMQTVGTNNNVNIIIYVSTNVQGQGKKSRKIVVYKNKSTQVGSTANLDSGAASTVIDACKWAIQSYPAQHYAFIFWNHGNGWRDAHVNQPRGVCFDDTTGNNLTDIDLMNIFQTVTTQYLGGKKVDIVGFDACLMANAEVAYSLAPYVNYMVASEETIPGDGWPYAQVLAPFAKATITPQAFANVMVSAYGAYYKPQLDDYTLAAMDLSKLPAVVTGLNQVSSALISLLQADNTGQVSSILDTCSSRSTHFAEPTYVDLTEFLQNLLSNINNLGASSSVRQSLQTNLNNSISAIGSCVMSHVQGSLLGTTKGMSIYLPTANDGIDQTYFDLYWSQNTQWPDLLVQYLG